MIKLFLFFMSLFSINFVSAKKLPVYNLGSQNTSKSFISHFYSFTSDTVINPNSTTNLVDTSNPKISIGNSFNSLNIYPNNRFNNGIVFEPVTRTQVSNIPVAFYLRDTSSWSFYTNTERRLLINGNGQILTNGNLLINTDKLDGISSLRVNGNGRFDSGLFVKGHSDTISFISMHRNVKSAAFDPDDGFAPYTTTPTAWAFQKNIPVLRIRHPNNISGLNDINTSIQRDFMILPYQYGMAIEFNGVVECWVGEWSIHKGLHYNDAEGNGNGWGGVFWVGDDLDGGGLRGTARNNIPLGGNLNYGELSVEKFDGLPNGDLRFRLPSISNNFQFVYGKRGSENIIASISEKGLVLPVVNDISNVTSPSKSQMVFDSSDNNLKYFNGIQWKTINDLKTGSYTLSSTGTSNTYKIPHGLNTIPTYYNVIPTSIAAANIGYITADNNFIYINYSTLPVAGFNNLSWNFMIKM
jgi:hypothetical protein